MKILRPNAHSAPTPRRGVALLLSMMVLIVVIVIVSQINHLTNTDARVAHNDITLTTMDLAIESALLEVYERLKEDASSSGDEGTPEGSPEEQPPPVPARPDPLG